MKTLFNLLKLFPAFRKLLNDFFESERKELQGRITELNDVIVESIKDALDLDQKAAEKERENENLRAHISTLLSDISDRDAQIAELKNATTEKLQAVDSLPADDVWNGVFRPKPGPEGYDVVQMGPKSRISGRFIAGVDAPDQQANARLEGIKPND